MRKPGATVNVFNASSGESGGAGGATTPPADCSVGPVVGRVGVVVAGAEVGRGAVGGAGFVDGPVVVRAACGFIRPGPRDAQAPVMNAAAHPASSTIVNVGRETCMFGSLEYVTNPGAECYDPPSTTEDRA
jgi:hypothetical protein